jgi:hypothetical protein
MIESPQATRKSDEAEARPFSVCAKIRSIMLASLRGRAA